MEHSRNREIAQSRNRTVRLVLVGVVAIVIAWVFLSRFVLVELNIRRLGAPVLLAIAEAVAILGVGRGAQLLMHRTGEARIRIDFLAGYPLFGAICFLVGLISTHRWTMAAILLAGVIGGTLAVRSYARGGRVQSLELTATTFTALAMLIGGLVIGVLNAQLPAVSLDEVAYHLAVPRIWVNEGRVVDLPLLSHSYFPFGLESADLPLLALLGADGAIASHFLHLLAAIATAIVALSWLRRHVAPELALVGAAAVLTTPALLITAGWSWNEWPLVGICLALLWVLDRDQPDRGAVAALIAAGMMTKYSFPLYALAVVIARRDRFVTRSALIGAAAGSLFYIRNLILTGNPFSPMFERLAPDVAAYQNSFIDYIFDGAFLDESVGIAAIVFAAAALLIMPRERFLRGAVIALTVAAVIVASGRPSSRLLLAFLIPLALIGWSRIAHPRLTWLATTLAALQLLLCAVYISRLGPFDVLAGRVSDEHYASTQRQPLADVLWADQRLPENSRTLVLGANELFWFSHRVRGGGNFDHNRIANYLQRGQLRQDGITHIFVLSDGLRVGSQPEAKREQERTTTLSPEAAIALRELLTRETALVAADGNRAIYALK